MKLNFLKFARHFLITFSAMLTVASAQAISSGKSGLPPSETPLLLKAFETESQKEGRREWTPLQYLSYTFGWVKEENRVGVFAELGKAMGELSPIEAGILQEFKNLQKEMVHRGYEPAVSTNWVQGKELSFSYDDPMHGKPGPNKSYDEPSYTHQFRYQFSVNFQKKGRLLESHEFYPRVTFNGVFALVCKTKWDDCRVDYSYGKSAEVSWEIVPGWKTGGNSSAGGGPRPTFSLDKAMLTKEEIEKISKSQGSR